MATSDAVEIIYKELFFGDQEAVIGLEALRAATRIGITIKETRESMGMTVKELADKAAVLPSLVSKIENGSYEGVGLARLFRVVYALDHRLVFAMEPAKDQ